MTTTPSTVRVAAMADIHCTRTSQGVLQPLFQQAADVADVLVLGGDLTDYGLPEEARVLAKELSGIRVPVVAVLGNHDFESGKETDVCAILNDAGVHVLDGESFEALGVGFAGTKGFAGGFGRATLGAWGETTIKNFVNEAVHESLKLETALARLRNMPRIAVLHYSPIRATVVGEPLEIFPFLGCGRLEEPLTRYPVVAVIHGHAHNGTPEGATTSGMPVYNVSLPLLRKVDPKAPPMRIIEVATTIPETPPTTPYVGLERRTAGADRAATPAPATSTP
jgi:Icc-related predicted phosphoesterase